jgi:hypothetical protein
MSLEQNQHRSCGCRKWQPHFFARKLLVSAGLATGFRRCSELFFLLCNHTM